LTASNFSINNEKSGQGEKRFPVALPINILQCPLNQRALLLPEMRADANPTQAIILKM
jgi:hypothetical protein